jgi:hypothetical protein
MVPLLVDLFGPLGSDSFSESQPNQVFPQLCGIENVRVGEADEPTRRHLLAHFRETSFDSQ